MNHTVKTTAYTEYWFNDADHALRWATEVLRARRFPKIASFYLEAEAGENSVVELFRGENGNQPKDTDDRLSLALLIYRVVDGLPDEQFRLLRHYYWGDFVDEATYCRATAFQERMRQEGKRVRLNYRLSLRQLGRLFYISDKTAAKRVKEAQAAVAKVLQTQGLI